ncbi:hypothetical protein D3C71_2029790 [compost metagenome]
MIVLTVTSVPAVNLDKLLERESSADLVTAYCGIWPEGMTASSLAIKITRPLLFSSIFGR